MSIEEALRSSDSAVDNDAEPYSASWWHSLSTEELRRFINQGFGSAVFEAASVETERRARERRRADDAAEQVETARKKRLRLLILEGFLLFSLLALIAIELMR